MISQAPNVTQLELIEKFQQNIQKILVENYVVVAIGPIVVIVYK